MNASDATSSPHGSEASEPTDGDPGVLSGSLPPGERSLNPFVLVADAAGFIDFLVAVFDGREVSEARSPMPDGTLIHAEVELGDSRLLIVDPQPGWLPHPGCLQLWVGDLAGVLERALARGATIVTAPTPFWGSIDLARLEDPWGNLWWLYQPVPGQPDPVPHWEEGGSDVLFSTLDRHLRARAGRH